MDQMKDTLKEAKSVLAKANDDMAQYYNCRRFPAPFFSPSDMVYLDSEDIQTTRPSKKLSHRPLGPYPVERRVGKYAYCLVLPPLMRRLHPVFNVVKLSPAPNDLIGQNPPPLPELVDGEEEYVVEKILSSRMFQQKLQYLVKWEGYGIEGNTWEYSENLDHAPEKVTEFHTKNLGAPRHIHALTFGLIPFRPISLSSALSRCSSGGGVIVRGTPPTSPSASASTSTSRSPSASTSTFRSRFQLAPQCCTYHLQPTTASNLPPTSAALACYVAPYLTCTYMYSSVSVLFFISVTLYINPYLQVDPYDPLLGMLCLVYLLHNNLDLLLVPRSAPHPAQPQ